MKFCDKCGSLIVPSKEKEKILFICRKCNKLHNPEGIVISEERLQEKNLISIEQEEENLPTTDYKCAKCGNNTAYWWTMQTRSSDEPETRFFRCTKCSHTWREYD